jgi:hypothetical protein
MVISVLPDLHFSNFTRAAKSTKPSRRSPSSWTECTKSESWSRLPSRRSQKWFPIKLWEWDYDWWFRWTELDYQQKYIGSNRSTGESEKDKNKIFALSDHWLKQRKKDRTSSPLLRRTVWALDCWFYHYSKAKAQLWLCIYRLDNCRIYWLCIGPSDGKQILR